MFVWFVMQDKKRGWKIRFPPSLWYRPRSSTFGDQPWEVAHGAWPLESDLGCSTMHLSYLESNTEGDLGCLTRKLYHLERGHRSRHCLGRSAMVISFLKLTLGVRLCSSAIWRATIELGLLEIGLRRLAFWRLVWEFNDGELL